MRLTILLFLLLLVKSVSAHVRLVYPEGGEVLFPGQQVTISWIIQVPHNQLNWDVLFSPDNGVTWTVIAEDLDVEILDYNWNVPDIETMNGLIRIVMDNVVGNYHDDSDPFTIIRPKEGPFLISNPVFLNFESIELDDEGLIELSLMNYGNEELIINSFSDLNTPFELVNLNELPINLSPGKSTEISVKFNPTIEGEFSDILQISNNSSDVSAQIEVSGEGVYIEKAELSVCYASTGLNEGGSLLSIEIESGRTTKIADLENIDLAPAIAINAVLDAYVFNPSDNTLYKISCSTGKSVKVFDLNASDVAMDFDKSDVLYYVGMETNGDRNLYRYNIENREIKKIGGVPHRFTGISFDPKDDKLYGITKEGELHTINKTMSFTTLVGQVGHSGMTDIAFDANGNLFGVYGGGISKENKIISIDKLTGEKIADIGNTGFTSVAGLAFAKGPEILSAKTPVNSFFLDAFPNPFTEKINVKISNHDFNEINLTIYTMTGQLIKSFGSQKGEATVTVFWDGKDSNGNKVAPGIYLIVSQSGNGIVTKQILFR